MTDAVRSPETATALPPQADAVVTLATDAMGEHLARVGAALDLVLGRPPTDAVGRREAWTRSLRTPMPSDGAGADAVVAEIVDVLVPNGTRLTDPGFWGWITVGALHRARGSGRGGLRRRAAAPDDHRVQPRRGAVARLARGAVRPLART